MNVRRAEAAKNYLKLFRDNEIDVILMPPAAHTAVPLDQWTKAAYNCLWNYLDYPAIVVPTDHVRGTDSADDVSNAQFGAEDEKLYSLCTWVPFLLVHFRMLKLTLASTDTDPVQYKDAPLGILVVGYKHKDEALLKAAAVIDLILNKVQ